MVCHNPSEQSGIFWLPERREDVNEIGETSLYDNTVILLGLTFASEQV
jgi:hypothetical protein